MDPRTLAETARTSRFTARDGVTIVYDLFGETIDQPLAVLQHGFAADARINWLHTGVIAALVQAGRRVLAVDARGHGRSDKPHDPERYGEAAMARDLMDIVESIGAPVYDLVGYSMGAIISLLVAAQDTRVRRLVIGGVGEGVVVCGGVDTRILPNLALAEALEADEAPANAHPGAVGMAAFAKAMGADCKALAAQARAVHATPIALERIAAPTLLLAGDADPLAVRPEVLAAAIPGAELVKLDGDHLRALLDPRCVEAILGHLA
jgi:pimeloyl-ACP methyl ester carboxylesterase